MALRKYGTLGITNRVLPYIATNFTWNLKAGLTTVINLPLFNFDSYTSFECEELLNFSVVSYNDFGVTVQFAVDASVLNGSYILNCYNGNTSNKNQQAPYNTQIKLIVDNSLTDDEVQQKALATYSTIHYSYEKPTSSSINLWHNLAEDELYARNPEGTFWVSSAMYSIDFEEPGNLTNNEFMRYGNIRSNIPNVGPRILHDAIFYTLEMSKTNFTTGSFVIFILDPVASLAYAPIVTVNNSDPYFKGEILISNNKLFLNAGSKFAVQWQNTAIGQNSNTQVKLNYRKAIQV